MNNQHKRWNKCTDFVRAFQIPYSPKERRPVSKEGKSNEEGGSLTTEMAGQEVSGSCCPTSPLLSRTFSSSSSSSSSLSTSSYHCHRHCVSIHFAVQCLLSCHGNSHCDYRRLCTSSRCLMPLHFTSLTLSLSSSSSITTFASQYARWRIE